MPTKSPAKKLNEPTRKTEAPQSAEQQSQSDDLLTTPEVAERIGTDPRTFRKFLRDQNEGVGKGNRYAIERKRVTA